MALSMVPRGSMSKGPEIERVLNTMRVKDFLVFKKISMEGLPREVVSIQRGIEIKVEEARKKGDKYTEDIQIARLLGYKLQNTKENDLLLVAEALQLIVTFREQQKFCEDKERAEEYRIMAEDLDKDLMLYEGLK
jgi:hypothetical protein